MAPRFSVVRSIMAKTDDVATVEEGIAVLESEAAEAASSCVGKFAHLLS